MVDYAGLDDRDVCIVSAARTPMGAFMGSLSGYSAPDLGGFAIKAALERAGIPGSAVQEVFFGHVVSANVGQAPATQAALKGGIPSSVPATSINKVCASGMKAVVLAAQSIITGDNDIVVAGGMESMSNIPHYMPRLRAGVRMGHMEVVDGMLRDGLWDPYSDVHMGNCAELCAERYGITRDAMDAHAVEAFERAKAAEAAGFTARELAPVPVRFAPGVRGGGGGGGRGPAPGAGELLSVDESLGKLDVDKLRGLKPFFQPDGGTVTAGNSSPITDGGAALVLVSGAAARAARAPVLALVRGYGDANQDPEWFTTAPAAAIPKALARARLEQADVDFWEVNQAFSVVDLVNQQLLGLAPERVNAHGGAVALGHPLGASGAVIIGRLLNVLRSRGARYGCAAICNGGGGATAIVIEALQQESHM